MKSFILIICLLLISIFSYSQTTPTVQASNITFSNISYNTFTVSCKKGNGTKRAFFIKQTKTISRARPVNNTTYTANSIFKSGSQIGTSGWYCIYNDTGNIVNITGLSFNTSYVIHICEYNGNIGSQKYLTTTKTTNTLSQKTDNYSVWNGSSWSAGTPNKTTYTIINGNYIGSSLITKQLIINSACTLTLNPGINLTSYGKVIVNGNLILLSDGIKDGSFINYDSVIGNITINKYISPNQWHLICKPVQTYFIDSIKQFYPQLYDETLDKFTRSWLTTGHMLSNIGYAIWSKNVSNIISFKGSINYQSTINIIKTNKGYNLIGNPYTSCLDWESSNWDMSNISSTIWIWNGTQYSTYTKGIGGTNGGSRYIASAQGFIIQANNNTSFTLDNRTRVHNTTTVLKSAIVSPYQDIIIINAFDNIDNDQCIIAYRDSALNETDKYDGNKMFGIPSIHSIYCIEDDRQLAINTLYDKDTIYFNVKTSYRKNITLSFDNYLNKEIELYDYNNKVELQNNTYKTIIDTTDINRFYLKIKEITLNFIPVDTIPMPKITSLNEYNSKLVITSDDKRIYINGLLQYTQIEVCKISGEKIYSDYILTDKYVIEGLISGLYVVRVSQLNSTQTKVIKIF